MCSSGVVHVPYPRENSGEPRWSAGRLVCPTNQVLRFERLKEFNNIGKELGPGNREVLNQGVRDLINRVMRLQELPNLQSDRIETETNPLLNIQQHCSVLGGGFPDARCDHDIFGSNQIFHSSRLWTLDVAQAEHRRNMSLHARFNKETFLLQEFVQTRFRGDLRVSSKEELRPATITSCVD